MKSPSLDGLKEVWTLEINPCRYAREKNYAETAGKTLLSPFVKLIVFGSGEQTIEDAIQSDAKQIQEQSRDNNENKAKKLLFCFFGLQAAYLIWGVLQEKIMTRQVCKLWCIFFTFIH